MVTADNDRRFQLTIGDHLVKCEADAVTLAESDPTDARWQSLELDTLGRHIEPIVEMWIVRNQFLHLGIGLVDILRISRKCSPAERADAARARRSPARGQSGSRSKMPPGIVSDAKCQPVRHKQETGI